MTDEITIANGVKVRPGDTVYESCNPSMDLIADKSVSNGSMILLRSGQLAPAKTCYANRNDAIDEAIRRENDVFRQFFNAMARCEARIMELEAMKGK